jgi:sterol 14-demethylase
MGQYRIVVDRALCQGHSVCVNEAPEIFRVVDIGMAYPQVEVILERPPADLLIKAEAAEEFCPNGVIKIIYED